MEKDAKIYVAAGHRGLVGSVFCRHLVKAGYTNVIYRTSADLDLRKQVEVESFFEIEKPDYVFLAVVKVGGIHVNSTYPGEFIYDNLAIQTNVIHAAYMHDVRKLMFLCSSCIYPKFALQPMREEYLLSGDLEPTNKPYVVAKITGMKMCEYYNKQYGRDFLAVMSMNLYGPNDNFELEKSHVLPALIHKFNEAKEQDAPSVEIWGMGKPRREFLHVDDLAELGWSDSISLWGGIAATNDWYKENKI